MSVPSIFRQILLLFALIGSSISYSQIINTIAGNSTIGYSGDGGAATVAKFNRPTDVAVDKTGNIYIADVYNHCVRKINTSGIISTIAGTGSRGLGGDGKAATDAQLYTPCGVCLDSKGNVYITDHGNHRIRRVDVSSGIITTVAGADSGGYNGDEQAATIATLYYPYRAVLDKHDNLYIADFGNFRIRKVDISGRISTIAGTGIFGYGGDGGAATLAKMGPPSGIAVDRLDNIYICDHYNHRVRKIDTAGIITTIAGNGSMGFSGDSSAATAAQFRNVFGICVDIKGNIYLADEENNRIRKVDTAGFIYTIAGKGPDGTSGWAFSGDGGPATAAQFAAPYGITVDAIGNVYITDDENNRVRKITYATGATTVSNYLVAGIFTVYPNPVTNMVTVTATNNALISSVTITNIAGRQLQHIKGINNKTLQADISSYPPGLYLLRIKSANGSITEVKVVKE